MSKTLKLYFLPFALLVCWLSEIAQASTISNGSYTVGIGDNGTLFSFSTPSVGFRRESDGLDPIKLGRGDSWGIAIGQVGLGGGRGAYATSGNKAGIMANGKLPEAVHITSVLTSQGNSARVVSKAFDGVITITQDYYFSSVVDNVLVNHVRINRESADLYFSRDVSWGYPSGALVTAAGKPGEFEGNVYEAMPYMPNPDPSIPYNLFGGIGPLHAGGTFFSGQQAGAAIKVRGSSDFYYYYAISSGRPGNDVMMDLINAGAGYVVISSGASILTNGSVVRSVSGMGVSFASVPLPSAWLMSLSGLLMIMGFIRNLRSVTGRVAS